MEIQKEVRRGHFASPKSMKRFMKVFSKTPRTINTGDPTLSCPFKQDDGSCSCKRDDGPCSCKRDDGAPLQCLPVG